MKSLQKSFNEKRSSMRDAVRADWERLNIEFKNATTDEEKERILDMLLKAKA